MDAKCSCQICSGHIEFDASRAGEAVACPHCGMETTLFVPATDRKVASPPVLLPETPPANNNPPTALKCFCARCGRGIEYDGGQAGRVFECPHCGMAMQLPSLKGEPPPPPKQAQMYFYKLGGAEKGPYTIGQLRSLWNTGAITSDMLYRTEESQSWNQFLSLVEQLESPSPAKPSTPTKPQRQILQAQTQKGALRFQNPENGFIEEVPDGVGVLVLVAGCFYFASKGVWTHAVAGFLAALCTCGISWLIYPFFAKDIMRTHYLRKGWVLV
jgi:DNA-directed RNA polymerase subunit RPC12/RpoP